MPRLRPLISLLVLLSGVSAVVAQPKASLEGSAITITGRVQSEGKPLSGALITLWEQPFGDPSDRSTVATGGLPVRSSRHRDTENSPGDTTRSDLSLDSVSSFWLNAVA
jgi:hypothetical protein